MLVGRTLSSPVTIIQQGFGDSLLYSLENTTSPFYVASVADSAPVAIHQVTYSDDCLVPFTVLVTNESVITADVLKKTIALYTEDYVYTDGFLDG